MTTIENLIQKIQDSRLSPANKARLIRFLQTIRTALNMIRQLFRALLKLIREHRAGAKIIGVALLLAIVVQMVPIVGRLLSVVIVLVGIGATCIVELRQVLNGLFTVDVQ